MDRGGRKPRRLTTNKDSEIAQVCNVAEARGKENCRAGDAFALCVYAIVSPSLF
jgi:hypothetical protein